MNSTERIGSIITELIFNDSFWGYLFSKVNRDSSEVLEAPMGVVLETDGSIILLYNPNYIKLMDDDFLKVAIQHEGIHILNDHIPRLLRIISDEINKEMKSKKEKKWNIAADCAVNSLLLNIKKYYILGTQKFELWFPDNFNLPNKKSSEFYFENINDDNQNNGSEKSINNHDGWTKNIKNISDISSLASRAENYSYGILEQAYNNVRDRSNIPGYIQEKINEILNTPKLPYYQMIAKLIKGTRLSKTKKAYTRINKKRVYSFFINKNNFPLISPFPGKTKDYSFNISIILDTSGSMRKDQILEGLSGVKNIIENDKYCATTIIECDTIIQKEYVVKKLTDIDYTIKGRGGTTLFPAFKRCKELNTDVTVVFTDGECDNINLINRELLPKKIIYIITNNGTTNYVDKTGFIVRLPE